LGVNIPKAGKNSFRSFPDEGVLALKSGVYLGILFGLDEKLVVFDGAAESKALTLVLDAHHFHSALQLNRSVCVAEGSTGNRYYAVELLTLLERLLGNAVKAIARQILRSAFDGEDAGFSPQIDGPMERDSFPLAAFLYGYHGQRVTSVFEHTLLEPFAPRQINTPFMCQTANRWRTALVWLRTQA
jgi:hypothetical protein